MENKILTPRFGNELRKLAKAQGGAILSKPQIVLKRRYRKKYQELSNQQLCFFKEFWDRHDRGINKILRSAAEAGDSSYVFATETYVGSCLTTQLHFASSLTQLVAKLGLFTEILYDEESTRIKPTDTVGLKVKVFW